MKASPRTTFLTAIVFAVLASFSTAAEAQKSPRADTLGIDGIYTGKIGMQLDTKKGSEYEAAAKLVLMPDGQSAVLTAQHPDGVVSVVMHGGLKGSVFYSDSKGKTDYGGYRYPMKWDIAFDAKRGTAVIHGKATDRPKWAHDDDYRYTFLKQAAKKR